MAEHKKQDLVELYEAFTMEELEERLDLCICVICDMCGGGSGNLTSSVSLG